MEGRKPIQGVSNTVHRVDLQQNNTSPFSDGPAAAALLWIWANLGIDCYLLLSLSLETSLGGWSQSYNWKL